MPRVTLRVAVWMRNRAFKKQKAPGLKGIKARGQKCLKGLRHPLREEKRETISQPSACMIRSQAKRFPNRPALTELFDFTRVMA